MKRTIIPGARTGRVRIPASKSQAHRLLICAALGEEKTEVVCDGISTDIAATAKCLSALGAKIEEMETGFLVSPIKKVPEGRCDLYCGESGSTLRFLLPIVGALGAQAVFHREGRLPQRPLAPLDSVLKEHGMTLREDGDLLYCSGQLIGGNYTIAGNVSSQYISGLLMALPLLIRDSLLTVSGPLESAAYVAMTEDALQLSKLTIPKMGAMWAIPGQQRCHLPKRTVVEGDWSNTAFFLCMGALSKEGVTVEGLNLQSSQGDRGVLDVLRRFGAEVTEHGDAVTVRRGALHGVTINAAPIPDLIPVLSVVASVAEGETRVENAYRLRLKESDRLKSTANLLRALGGQVEEKEDGLVITGVPALHGGAVEEMTMDEYLLGVLRAEMPASFEEEALKAQAIAARTYTLYRIRGGGSANHPDADACDDHTCCKAYLSAEQAAANWGSMAVYYEEKLARAVSETDGEVILYDGAPILAVFFSSADGSTQGAGDVWMNDLPYLQKVDSPETEELVPNYYSVATFTAAEFKSLILAAKPDADLSGSPEGWIRDIVRNDSDYVASVTVGGVKLRGNDLRTILSLRSPSFTVEYKDNAFTFHVTGYGHGVGMSQYGANILAKQGLSAEEIVQHYFSNTTVGYYDG